MARVKTGPYRRRRHKEVLKAVRGSRLSRGRHYKVAHEQLLHQGQYAFEGRKLRKRDFRRLWIQRINAGLSSLEEAPSYSVLVNLMKQKNITINRKMLAELAVVDIDAFKAIVNQAWGK